MSDTLLFGLVECTCGVSVSWDLDLRSETQLIQKYFRKRQSH